MNLEDIHTLHLDKHKFYFVLPWGLGDTMIFCGLKNALEEKLGGTVHFIIKPSHEIIMKMYRISSYTLVKIDAMNKQQRQILFQYANQNPNPEKGNLYIAHPEFHPQYEYLQIQMGNPTSETKFLTWYKDFLGLLNSIPMQHPIWYPTVSDDLKKRLSEKISVPVNKIILIFPEANSITGISTSFWRTLIKKLPKEQLLTNSLHPEYFEEFSDIPNIDLSLEEAVALALNCKEVYALRSGICDLIFSRGKNLHVFYPSENIKSVFSLNDCFNTQQIDEVLISSEENFVKLYPQKAMRIGLFKRVAYSMVSRYYFLGINFITKVER